jgi:peptide-methionine (S)-S-oxide reductase
MNRALGAVWILLLALLLGAATPSSPTGSSGTVQETSVPSEATAIFAGGCFWCMEEAFEKVDGVTSVISGYTGGAQKNPTYEQVSSGGTGHFESVEVHYHPREISYRQLLEVFWRNIDPTDGAGQFCDKGSQYRSAIFYQNETEKQLAEASKKALAASKPFPGPILTLIVPASTFYPAEDYHQDYYKKNPIRYHYYKWACGRAQRLEELWGPPDKKD